MKTTPLYKRLMKNTPAGTPALPIKPIPAPKKRDPKDARNCYRRKHGIPLHAPKHTRAEPFNAARRGTGNVGKMVYMPQDWWEALDENKGDQTRGEHIMQALHCNWETEPLEIR